MRQKVFGLAVAALLWTAPLWSEPATLAPQAARAAAARLLTEGYPRATLDVTAVLLERDPQDVDALILRAHAQRTLQDNSGAQVSARKAWQYSTEGVQKYEAARVMAQALSSDDRKSRAQLWLRRAAQVAPTEQLRNRAVRDYQYVRFTNPWSVKFRFGIAPSDNVNNAPLDNTVILGGLLFEDETAIPLSGVEISTGVDLRYNFNISRTRRNFVLLSWDQKRVVITDDDKPLEIDEDDFRYTKLEAALGRDFKTAADAPSNTVSLSLGRIWSGGDHLADEVRVRFRQTHKLADGATLNWYSTFGYADRQDNADRSGITSTLGATWSRPVGGGSRLALSAKLSRTDTDSAVVTHDAVTLGATYTLGRPVLSAVATFSAFGTFRRYDDAVYGPDPRRDDGAVLSTSLFFKDFDTYGFAPKVAFTARRTNSNISSFDTRDIRVSIGLQSVF